ncbi:MAG TPA: MFS transporter [Chitinophagaceae bacterium]
MKERSSPLLLPLLILSQFAGTSLWFAGNAILPDLQRHMHLDSHAISQITTAVQIGFITGTLFFALLSIADRFSSATVFFASTCLAAFANVALVWIASDVFDVLILRFATGFFLAGIYPVGMKIAADWYEKGLGKALGYLVGALVLGTSFPHLLKGSELQLPWERVLLFTSLFAFMGGLLVKVFIGDGPYRKRGSGFHPRAMIHVFRSASFRAAAFGYFGHMWELYTFWAFLPLLLQMYIAIHGESMNISLFVFLVIAAGSVSCVLGGYWSQKIGSARVAWYALLCSGLCCVAVPFMINTSLPVFILFVIFWSLSVIADSPQFSTLVAQTAPVENKGTALTFVTSIGFFITVVSIFLFDKLMHLTNFSVYIFMILAIGPLLGLIALKRSI